MQRDLRGDPTYISVQEHLRRAHEPAVGRLGGAIDAQPSRNGHHIAMCGPLLTQLTGLPAMRIGVKDVAADTMRMLGTVNDDVLPRWSPVDDSIAFASDRRQRGVSRLYLAHAPQFEPALHAAELDETIESLAWSPDGMALLLQTVGFEADKAGAQGSGTVQVVDETIAAWMPEIEENVPANLWRRLWLYCPADASLRRIGPSTKLTVWEAAWCGNRIVAIVSDDPREGAWYQARLALFSPGSDSAETLYVPAEQLGCVTATPDGRYVAVVEACCSDRLVVAGDVLLFDLRGGAAPRRVDTHGVNVTSIVARSANSIAFAGIRGFEAAMGEIDTFAASARIVWNAHATLGARYPYAAPAGESGYVAVTHAYDRPPAVVLVNGSRERVVHDFGNEGSDYIRSMAGKLEECSWNARDGLEIQGYLVRPESAGPHPLVVMVHGGPVWAFSNAWQMFYRLSPLLARAGYAVLHPNPRGSSGRGQDFARMVRGDMCGEDTHDILTGIDALIGRGIADASRLAITGGSYGGYMSSWIVTQTPRFAAAIPVAPVTDAFSQHFTSNIPHFDSLFLADDPYSPDGKHQRRSPVRFARSVTTPTLSIAGALDRCTPASQAIEFHRALVENGTTSELAIYPREGHGIREYEATIDYFTRVLLWLERHFDSSQTARK